MKTASHFLRNQGEKSLAIIDTHIIKYLQGEQHRNAREYLEMETEFRKRADEVGMSVAALDAYVWKVSSGTFWKDFIF